MKNLKVFSCKLPSPKVIKHHISNYTSKAICHLILSNYNSILLSFYPYLYSNPNDIPKSLLNRSPKFIFETFERMNWPEIKRRWEDRMWNFGQGQTTHTFPSDSTVSTTLSLSLLLLLSSYTFNYSNLSLDLYNYRTIISFINTILPLSPF